MLCGSGCQGAHKQLLALAEWPAVAEYDRLPRSTSPHTRARKLDRLEETYAKSSGFMERAPPSPARRAPPAIAARNEPELNFGTGINCSAACGRLPDQKFRSMIR
jgi:hypothetical protein